MAPVLLVCVLCVVCCIGCVVTTQQLTVTYIITSHIPHGFDLLSLLERGNPCIMVESGSFARQELYLNNKKAPA